MRDSAHDPSRWEAFHAGITVVDVGTTRFVLAPARGPVEPLPGELHGLFVVTSDNPGGFLREEALNRERRIDLRAEMASLRLAGRVHALHPSLGAADLSLSAPEVGFAADLDEDAAVLLGHAYGQLGIYHLVPEGRRLLSCAILQRNVDASPRPMTCTVLPR